MNKLFDWLNNKFLPYFVALLLIFIPLYPKLPVFGVTHTWVYIRAEDLLIGVAVLIWAVLWLKKKVTLPKTLTIPILLFWLVGFVSTFFAIFFIFPHIANVFPTVAVFHFLRRIEYLTLFFVAFSTVKKSADLRKFIAAIVIAVVGVVVYGILQKTGAVPAFLTMNEEFAKGIPIYLPSTARITSTFGGHYDLAAYLVMMIALLFSLFFGIKNIFVRFFLLALSVASLVLLLFTASRVSFGVYLATIVFMLLLQKKKIFIIPVIIISLLLLAQVKGTAERFAKTFRIQPIVINSKTGQPVAILEKLPPEISGLKPTPTPQEETLPLGSGFIGLPPVTDEPEATSVAVIRKTVSQSLKLDSKFSEISTISGSFLIQKAFVYDISFTTRFQGGWPRAWKAFQRNWLLGSGYSSIDLASDNDYLRMLGETGVLGLISFFFIFSTYFLLLRKNLAKIISPLERSFIIGTTAGVFGLFLNAILIDVFEASKVAQVLWILLGLSVGLLFLRAKNQVNLFKETMLLVTNNWFILIYLFLLSFYAYAQIFPNYFTGSDFQWLKGAADLKAGNFLSNFVISGQFFQPLTKFLYFALYSVFWLKPFGYHLMSIFLYFSISVLVFLISQRVFQKKLLAFCTAVIFLLLPFNNFAIASVSGYAALLSTLFILLSFFAFLSRKMYGRVAYSLVLACYVFGLLSLEIALILPLLVIITGVIQERSDFIKNKSNVVFCFFLLLFTGIYWWTRNNFSGHNVLDLNQLPANGNFYGGYALLLSAFALIFITAIFYKLLGLTFSKNEKKQKLIFVLVAILLFILCMTELAKKLSDWKTASEIGRKIIYSIKDNYKSYPMNSKLYFANLPRTQGNAEIFNTGLDEALWFIYRDKTLQITAVSKSSDLPKYEVNEKDIYRFVYEDNQLKIVTFE